MQSEEAAQAWAKVLAAADSFAETPDLATAPVRTIEAAGLTLDYTRSLVSDESTPALSELAEACELPRRFEAMFSGDKINSTERRSVLHTRLRDPAAPAEIKDEMERMLAFAGELGAGNITGKTGQPFESILHIGIGGSALGPRLISEALPREGPVCRFVANIDPAGIGDALEGLDPARTLIVSVSKSGRTTETMENTMQAKQWVEQAVGDASEHLVAVSADGGFGERIGCLPERRFVMWDWVGGRYSLCSPVSVSAAASCGPEAFKEFLVGAREMDAHALGSSGWGSMPVAMALLRLWHAAATGSQTHCVVAYQHRLRSLPSYLQQLVMESNGKSATLDGGRPVQPTSAVWWGGEGTNDQHSYFQLLLQGMRSTPADFVYARKPKDGESPAMHRQLVAHCLGQSRALFMGRDLEASARELAAAGRTPEEVSALAPHLVVRGGQPVNLLSFESLGPRSLGAVVSLYEHMTAALGWLWDINSFDQWGVELGKINFRTVLQAMESGKTDGLDPATADALRRLDS